MKKIIMALTFLSAVFCGGEAMAQSNQTVKNKAVECVKQNCPNSETCQKGKADCAKMKAECTKMKGECTKMKAECAKAKDCRKECQGKACTNGKCDMKNCNKADCPLKNKKTSKK